MVSRRNFATITLIMLVIFFLFQFSGAAKDFLNDYDVNTYAQETSTDLNAEDVAKAMTQGEAVFVGTQESSLYSTVEHWCEYTRRTMVVVPSCEDYEITEAAYPQVVILDSATTDVTEQVDVIQEWIADGINVIFGNLPDSTVIAENQKLMDILGIHAVYEDNVTIAGVHLFSGFLLGGERYYEVTNEEEEKMQDLDLTIPWYIAGQGTKSYMVGMMEGEEYEMLSNEYYPAIIWRNSIGNAKVFAVNGDYMNGTTGIGILDAMMYEMSDYEIYGVVNSQNLVVMNYPMFAEENAEEMSEKYSRNTQSVLRDIVWSGIVAVSENTDAKVTCMMAPQLNYADNIEPNVDSLGYFMKLIREEEGESGISLSQISDVSLNEKLSKDQSLLKSQVPDYDFLNTYVGDQDVPKALKSLEDNGFDQIRSIYRDYDDFAKPVGYATEDITFLRTTNDGLTHTFSEDLRQKSLETALAYSSISADFSSVIYPENDEDSWEKTYEKFSSYTMTFWQAFRGFDQTTLSEADERVRKFMATNYSDSREGKEIVLNVDNLSDQSWFLLRVHKEDVKDMKGAAYEEIEDGTYLIHANDSKVVITLEDSEHPYYYLDSVQRG